MMNMYQKYLFNYIQRNQYFMLLAHSLLSKNIENNYQTDRKASIKFDKFAIRKRR